jgi:hypothetical protein
MGGRWLDTWARARPGRRRCRAAGAPVLADHIAEGERQASLPSEAAAPILLFSLAVSGQIKLRRIDGWRKIAAVFSLFSQHTAVAA